jgi:subtilisin-like proprotein convertase family protein
VDIAHAARGDLRVELTAPDGTTVLLHQISGVRAPDIRATYGLTAVPFEPLEILRGRSAAGEWRLSVIDRRPLDVGTLLSWGLVIQFAGDAPLTARPRDERAQMIPVVTHVYGIDGKLFQSDVRIANTTDTARTATLIFTRSGENGLVSFSAVEVAIAAGQTVAYDDVLDTLFHTAGSGTLEVLGPFVVTSRTDGQEVSPNLEPATFVAPLPEEGSRYNFGLAERGGQRGTVIVNDREVVIEPFSHVQFPVGSRAVRITVVEGNPQVVAYISQIGADSMFIPAQFAPQARVGIAPVVSAPGWRSQVWFAPPETGVFEPPRTAAWRFDIAAGVFAATRIVSDTSTQFVPFLPMGPATQHLLFVESSAATRTNVGIVSDGPSVAEVRVYDAGGSEIERFTLTAPDGIAQMRVAAPVHDGRAEVRFLSGRGRAYASVLGADATFVAGQESCILRPPCP